MVLLASQPVLMLEHQVPCDPTEGPWMLDVLSIQLKTALVEA